jgi:hypothetical protein
MRELDDDGGTSAAAANISPKVKFNGVIESAAPGQSCGGRGECSRPKTRAHGPIFHEANLYCVTDGPRNQLFVFIRPK